MWQFSSGQGNKRWKKLRRLLLRKAELDGGRGARAKVMYAQPLCNCRAEIL